MSLKRSKRSAVLREVRENPLFSHKVEKPKKGKGSFDRKSEKHSSADYYLKYTIAKCVF